MRFTINRAALKLAAAVVVSGIWLLASVAAAPGEANLPFLFGVYTITWLAFFAYAFYMSRRQRDLRREIQELRRLLEERKGR